MGARGSGRWQPPPAIDTRHFIAARVATASALSIFVLSGCGSHPHAQEKPVGKVFGPSPESVIGVCRAAQQQTKARLLCPRTLPIATRGVFPDQLPDPLAAERLYRGRKPNGVSIAYGVPSDGRLDSRSFFHFTIQVYDSSLGIQRSEGRPTQLGSTHGRLAWRAAGPFGLYANHLSFLFSSAGVQYVATLHRTAERHAMISLLSRLVDALVPVPELPALTGRTTGFSETGSAGVWSLAGSGARIYAIAVGTRNSIDPRGRLAPAALEYNARRATRLSVPVVPVATSASTDRVWFAGRLRPSNRGGVVVRDRAGTERTVALGLRVAAVSADARGAWVALADPPELIWVTNATRISRRYDLPATPARVASLGQRVCVSLPDARSVITLVGSKKRTTTVEGTPFAVAATSAGCLVTLLEGRINSIPWGRGRPRSVSVGGEPVAIVYRLGFAYVANLTGGSVQTLSVRTLAVTATTRLSGDPTAVLPLISGRVLVGTNSQGKVLVVDLPRAGTSP
jgi:hypothetical protein